MRTNIGLQHHKMSECDVGDWYLMLAPSSSHVTNIPNWSITHLVSNINIGIRHQNRCNQNQSWMLVTDVGSVNEKADQY